MSGMILYDEDGEVRYPDCVGCPAYGDEEQNPCEYEGKCKAYGKRGEKR